MLEHERQVKVLAVDDEVKMTSFIASYLANEGYAVTEVHSGTEALKQLEAGSGYDVVLLDWMMPGLNGLDVCRQLRTYSDVPVIFLTAKSDEIDKLLGLELGADDFITKPFSMRELEARIRVILRRTMKRRMSGKAADRELETNVLIRGSLAIDSAGHTVHLDGKPVNVTPTEFKLLMTLARHPGRVYSRLDLLEIALGEEYAGYERSIDTHIRNLRKKVEQDFSNPELILTVHGVGYKLSERL